MAGRPRRDESEYSRRDAVLESAMETFSRIGYRKTSMEDVARAAHISRPGLYFLFDSKPVLFREAVSRALDRDLACIALILADEDQPPNARLVAAFDRWAGSYIGPLTHGEADGGFDPALLGSLLDTAPRRFEELVTAAVEAAHPGDAVERTRTLISASIGIKYQTNTRERYNERLAVAVDLLVGGGSVEHS
ncbi:TetR/AcrR family transcriptional regulator [Humibacter albus]|uniref:TetR/AcrR family transcriptional regulator n=1 Tax=Humibacter albus TaxID=427754 RepID=UPI0003B74B6A|nr:TetR/AcrR family transcriptional regulator [Humibacter albus]